MSFPFFWKTDTKASQGLTRTITLDNLSEFESCAFTGETITPQKAFKIYRENSSVATAVDMIADAFEQIKPIIEMSDGSIIDSSPILDLLRNPNPYMTWSDIAGRIAKHYLLTNQTHFYSMGTTTLPPQEVHPIKPTGISVTTGGQEYVQTFHVGQGVASGQYNQELAKQRIMRYFSGPLKELYRISGFSSFPTDGTADSPLQAAALETQQQLKGRVHNVKLLENGGKLSLLIVFKDEVTLNDDQHTARTKRINETFAGPEKSGKIGVMSGSDIQSVTDFGMNQKDMDYVKLDEISGRAIYFRYKIPLALVSVSASTFNNLETGNEMLYDNAVLPLANKMFSGLSRFLLPRYGKDTNQMRITYNPDSLQPLKNRRLKEMKERKANGIETTNELRESLSNREPVDGGDVIYQPATMVPLGTDMNDDGGGFDDET